MTPEERVSVLLRASPDDVESPLLQEAIRQAQEVIAPVVFEEEADIEDELADATLLLLNAATRIGGADGDKVRELLERLWS